MGNRAVIKPVDMNVGVYVHWNGGRDSVEGFLKYCEMKGYRGLGSDSSYGMARLCQVISNYFGGTCSVGVQQCWGTKDDAQGLCNGIYEVKGWEIVKRIGYNGFEQQNHTLQDMLESIDEAQPPKEQFGVGFLRAKEVPTSSLRIGDSVYLIDYNGKAETHEVVGFGADRFVNGRQVKGVPYVDLYGNGEDGYADNPNNYLRDETIRRAAKDAAPAKEDVECTT